MYGASSAGLRQAVGSAFKDEFGIDIEFTPGKDAEIRPKLLKERTAGLYLADIIMGGSQGLLQNYEEQGLFEPVKPELVLPEVLDKKVWYGGRLPFLDEEQTYVVSPLLSTSGQMVINTSMVKPEEISS